MGSLLFGWLEAFLTSAAQGLNDGPNLAFKINTLIIFLPSSSLKTVLAHFFLLCILPYKWLRIELGGMPKVWETTLTFMPSSILHVGLPWVVHLSNFLFFQVDLNVQNINYLLSPRSFCSTIFFPSTMEPYFDIKMSKFSQLTILCLCGCFFKQSWVDLWTQPEIAGVDFRTRAEIGTPTLSTPNMELTLYLLIWDFLGILRHLKA